MHAKLHYVLRELTVIWSEPFFQTHGKKDIEFYNRTDYKENISSE
jgi:hypothetical protein